MNPTPTTLRALAGSPSQPRPLDGSALIVIDAQHEYSESGVLPLHGLEPALDNIEQLESVARKIGGPVIHVAHLGKSGGLFDPKTGGRFLSQTAPQEDEHIISKSLPNSFAGTDLHATLVEAGIRDLVLVGFMTHMCVSSTARAALDLGYSTTVVTDATATRALPSPLTHNALPATTVHHAALAALADRFAITTTTSDLCQISGDSISHAQLIAHRS